MTRLAAPLTAVVVVVAVILLLIWINGRSGGSSGQTAASSPPSSSTVSTPSPSPSATHRAVSPTPAHRRTGPAPHSSHHVAPTTSPSASSAAPSVAAFEPVDILNNSRITGLAHHVAAEVESRGWTISQVGNLRGRVAETTVYYPDGEFDAAEHLAADFGSIQRVEPQADAGLDSGGLVLVVTRYWTD